MEYKARTGIGYPVTGKHIEKASKDYIVTEFGEEIEIEPKTLMPQIGFDDDGSEVYYGDKVRDMTTGEEFYIYDGREFMKRRLKLISK